MKASEDTLLFLSKHGLKPDTNPSDRPLAIYKAVLAKLPAVVEDLLGLYPEDGINARDHGGVAGGRKHWTPLHYAARSGQDEIARKLLEKGLDVNARTPNGWTPLIIAAENGHSSMVHILIQNKADIDAHTKAGNLSALHRAAIRESPGTALILLLHGADVKVTTSSKETPLHLAVKACCLPVAALLLFHGASATAQNKHGATPRSLVGSISSRDRAKAEHIFSCAASDGIESVGIEEIFKPGVTRDMASAIHWAVEKNLDRAVAYILHIDPYTIEATSRRRWRPLHLASKRGFNECVRVLLQHGADPNSTTRSGQTPLMLAAEKGHLVAISTLLDHGAKRDLKNNSNETALQVAQACKQRRAELFLKVSHVAPSDAAIEAPEKDGNGALSLPVHPGSRRTPSPRPGQPLEIEGELFALSDATPGEATKSLDQSSEYVEKFLATLERTWYDHVQWTPADDVENDRAYDWTGPVKIAILDSGIDLNHKDFSKPARRRTKVGTRAAKKLPEKTQRERIKAYRNFVGQPGEDMDVTDYSGHGTHIAGLILGIAPRAELYIAKTSTGQEHLQDADKKSASDKGRRESRRPVEDALRWAIEQNVDIINLSLGFPHDSSYGLTRALEEANHRGIAVFAAAANHGNRQAIAWPARDRDLAICVTSGDEFNKPSAFAPTSGDPDLPVFITHGENVVSHWPEALASSSNGFRSMSGTSVATPIAVGMAAMIIAFLNKTNAWSPARKVKLLRQDKEQKLRSTRGMGKLLEDMCRDRNGVKVLSPSLMWEDDPTADPEGILADLSRVFRLKG